MTSCPSGPGKSRPCLAFFGVEYQTVLWILLISLLIGFASYFVYSKIRKIKFEAKNYILKSLLISLVPFVIFLLFAIFIQGSRIY